MKIKLFTFYRQYKYTNTKHESSDPLLEIEKYSNFSRFRRLTPSKGRVLGGVVGARQDMLVTITVSGSNMNC